MNLVIEILIYAIIIFALVFLPFLQEVFPELKLTHIMLALVTLVAGSYLNLFQQFNAIKKKLSFLGLERIFHYDTFSKAMTFIESQINTVENLRIYDIATRSIYPAISSGTIKIKKCTLILQDFYPNDPDINSDLISEVNIVISKWKALAEKGIIENLEIYRFFDNPTDYLCIFDNKYAITGQYIFESTGANGNSEQDFEIKSLTPMLVTNETKQGSDMIEQYTERFDRLIEMSKFQSSKPTFYGNVLAFAKRTKEQKKRIFNDEIARTHSISAIGIANNELTSDLSYEFYKNFFDERSGVLRIMFSKPQCEQLAIREKDEGRASGSLSFFILHNIEDLNSFIDQCGQCSCDYQIKVYDSYPKINCIITDNFVFVHYYGQVARGLDVPTFVISREEDNDIYNYYKSEFDIIWDSGENY